MDVYETLRTMLDKHPNGCPPAPEIIEILKILFSEEEAKVALGLTFAPFSADVVAKRTGINLEEVKKRLESLSKRYVIKPSEKKGEKRYALWPTLPGIFEWPFMKNEECEDIKRLGELWHVYMEKLGKCFGTPSTSTMRVIPIEEEVPNEPEVLPYEKIYEMIDNAEVVGLGKCSCRVAERGAGHGCDAPLETCMIFDDYCTGMVENGIGRYATKEELKEKLRECDEYGLIHQTNNSQGKLTMVCACCTCCCVLFRSLINYGNPHVIASSGFVPQCDEEACIGCGICAEERCKLKAITMENDLPVINEERCVGCGLCVTGCPEEAMKLVRREDVKKPPLDDREIAMTVLKEKGIMEEFAKFNNPEVIPDYLKNN